jgi:cobalt-zinc-cadmium efflux system protein
MATILEGVPADIDIVELAARVGRTFAPASMHHVHVWEIGPSQRVLTAHVSVGQESSGREIEILLAEVKSFLREQWDINHATLEPEITGCEQADLLGRWNEARTDAPAAPSPSSVDGPRRRAVNGEGG